LFVGADLGDDGFRDPLTRRFVDLLKRGNCERDVLADFSQYCASDRVTSST
jgi:hypothetical protein